MSSGRTTVHATRRLCCGLLALLMVGLGRTAEQAPAPTPATPSTAPAEVPARLLEGTAQFNVAVLAHSDLRGNIGPCG